MNLHAYIEDMPRRVALAERLDTDPRYLWQIATGRRKASPKLALAIETATNRKVTRQELRPDVYPAKKRA